MYRFLGSDILSCSCPGGIIAAHANVQALHIKPQFSYKMKPPEKRRRYLAFFLS